MKKTVLYFLVAIFLSLLFVSCSPPAKDAAPVESKPGGMKYIGQGEPSGKYWPTGEWKTSRPEAVGMDSQKLAAAMEYASTPSFRTEGIVVVKSGYIVSEAYFRGFQKEQTHISNSMAKSFTSTLIGIAIDKGLISGIDVKLCQYYEDWDCSDEDDERSRITIRHAMTLTTGLEWHEDWSRWDPSTNDALKMGASGQFYRYMADRDGEYEPGERFYYSTGDPMLLSRVIQQVTGMSAFDFAKQNLFDPIGIKNVRWDKDRDGYTATAWGLHTTVREFAKFGYLFLNKGKWADRQIVSEEWVEKATKTDPSVKMWAAYGYLWHVNLPYRLRWSKTSLNPDVLPRDGYMAEGVLGQNIYIIPSHDLVIVKVANQTGGSIDEVKLLTMILDAEK